MQEEKQYKEPRTRALYPFAPLALSFACSHSLALDVYAYVIRNIDFLTTWGYVTYIMASLPQIL